MNYETNNLKIDFLNDNITFETIDELSKMANVLSQLNNHYYSIKKNEKNGRWITYVKTNGPKKRKQLSKSSPEELAEALSAYEITNPIEVNNKKAITVEDVFYMAYNKKLECYDIEKQSYDKYVNNFKRFFKNGISDISNRTIRSIDEDELEVFIKKTIRHYNLKPKGYRDMKCLIREIFKTARRHNQTNINISMFFEEMDVSSKLFNKSIKDETDCVFTDEEIEKLWNYVFSLSNPEVRDFGVLLGFFTGLRASEISALTGGAVNDKTIQVRRTEKRYKDEEGHYLYNVEDSGKTEASIRDIALVPESRILIKKIKELNPNGVFLFEKHNGERFIGKAFTNKIKSLCKAVGIKERSFHKTRATFITKMINAGVEETVILNQSGHTKIETSREHYEYNNRSLDNAAVQLENALSFKNFNH